VFTAPGSILKLTSNPEQRIRMAKKPHHKMRYNYVGTELEFICKKNQRDLDQDLIAAGLARYVYLKTDSSIRGMKEGEVSHELNILCKEEEMKWVIEKATQVLKAAGGRVNDSCGMHMHFDMRFRDHQKCFNNMVQIYPTLSAIIPNTRLRSEYCLPNPSTDFNEEISRRSAINREAYEKYRTLEVRLHSGTLSAKKICNWFALIKCAVDHPEYIDKKITVETFANFFEVSGKLQEYIKIRSNKFKNAVYDSVLDESEEEQYEMAI
jgi:hypothetical protein